VLSWRKSWNGSSRWWSAEHQTATMTAATLADWSTPRPFALPDLGPGLNGEQREALELALRAMAANPTLQALVLFGSRARGTARPDSDLDLLVVEHTPHLEGQAKVASWWHHFQPLQSLPLPVDLIVSGSADAARLAGSRWHVISEAARHGRVLVVQP
jgi:predicted nucleotidyltransferase